MPEEIFVLIIVAIVAVLLVIRAGLRHDRELSLAKYAAKSLPSDTASEELKAKVDRLEKRLAVLERITTEPSHRFAAEIDELGTLERI